MEKETEKAKIGLLLLIGFGLGASLGFGAGFGLAAAIFEGWKDAIVVTIISTIFGSIFIMVLSGRAIRKAHKAKELTHGTIIDLLGGLLGGFLFCVPILFIYGIGYSLGSSLVYSVLGAVTISFALRSITSMIIGAVLGIGLLWAVYYLLGIAARLATKKENTKPTKQN